MLYLIMLASYLDIQKVCANKYQNRRKL